MSTLGLAAFTAKCYGGTAADIVLELDLGERTRVHSEIGVTQSDAMGAHLFNMPLGTCLVATRQRFESVGVGVVAYMDDIEVAILRFTEEITAVIIFLYAELAGVGLTINTAKNVALPPPGHVPRSKRFRY